jgi:hypothetical protein
MRCEDAMYSRPAATSIRTPGRDKSLPGRSTPKPW